MRQLHLKTIKILSQHPEFPKTHISHCFSEQFKYFYSKKNHPKIIITDNYDLGVYIRFVYNYGIKIGCNLNKECVDKTNNKWLIYGFNSNLNLEFLLEKYFDDNYLFSDACSLYYKGINIFPDIFGDNWRKYVPVESLKEIKRQVDKTLNKKSR